MRDEQAVLNRVRARCSQGRVNAAAINGAGLSKARLHRRASQRAGFAQLATVWQR